MSQEYDAKFNNFLLRSPFVVESKEDKSELQFRSIKLPKQDGEESKFVSIDKVNAQTLFKEAFGNLIGDGFDLVEEFKHSGPIQHLETDNEFGFVAYALGKCLFILRGEVAHALVTGTLQTKNINLKTEVKCIKKVSNQTQ